MFKRRATLFIALLIAGALLLFVRVYLEKPQQSISVAPETLTLQVTVEQFKRFCREYEIDFDATVDTELFDYYQVFLEQELLFRQAMVEGLLWKDPVVQRLVLSNQEYLGLEQMSAELLEELVMNDSAIRRHVVRRAKHLLSYQSIEEPTPEVLRAYYDQHPELFLSEKRVTIQQRRYASAEAALHAYAKLDAVVTDPTDALQSPLPESIKSAGHRDISRYFGVGFADRIFEMARADNVDPDWWGPISTGFGFHLVKISDYQSPQVAPFNTQIMNKALGHWRNDEREMIYRRQLESLKETVHVQLDSGGVIPLPNITMSDLQVAL